MWYLNNWKMTNDQRGKSFTKKKLVGGEKMPQVEENLPDWNCSLSRVRPGTGSGSSAVETLQRKFLFSFRSHAPTDRPKATGIVRFLTMTVRPTISELLPPERKFAGIVSSLGLPRLGTSLATVDDGIIEVKALPARKTVLINGKTVKVPSKFFLMLKKEAAAEEDHDVDEEEDHEAAAEEDRDEDGAEVEDDDNDDADPISEPICLADWWPTIEALLFGTHAECAKIIKKYKILKKVSVVALWPEALAAWGLTEHGHGGPVCLAHCKPYALHTSCRCVFRVLAREDPKKYGEIFCHRPKGRPKKSVQEARKRMQAAAEQAASKRQKLDA
eukprot:g20073.t1